MLFRTLIYRRFEFETKWVESKKIKWSPENVENIT